MSEIVEHPEYNRDTNPYPSFGKKYNGEPAVISLTSWKARINTVSKTLYSLLTQCKNFHIVLVLSEEEFPKMCEELPENLMLFVENEMIELLWVYKNYKSFKKVLFTMDKYRDVPVISADDDCIYTCNYAQELYDKWVTDKNAIQTIHTCPVTHFQHGASTLYFPYCFSEVGLKYIKDIKIQNTYHDDVYYGCLAELLKIKIKDIWFNFPKTKLPYIFHDSIDALSHGKTIDTLKAVKIIRNELNLLVSLS